MALSYWGLHRTKRPALRARLLSLPIVSIVSIQSADAATIGSGATVNVSSVGNANSAFSGGTLAIDKTGTYSGNYTLTQTAAGANANVIDAKGNVGTFSGIFSDAVLGQSGNLTITDSVGNGQVVFTGVNTNTGPVTINSGATLAVTGAGSISISQFVQADGTFDISGATNGTPIESLAGSGSVVLGAQSLRITNGNNVFSGTISGTGSLTVSGGIETLDGTNTYTGGTIIASGGELQIGNADASGSIQGNIASSGTFVFNRSDSTSFSQTISGSGNVIINNGIVTITTPQSYTGTTTVNTQTLALAGNGDISNSSSIAVAGTFDISALSGASIKSLSGAGNVVLGNASLTITAGNDTFSGVISGSGGLTVSAGNEVISGTNTYTGGTFVTGGTLQLGNSTATGSVPGNIADAGTVAFNYSGAQSFDGVISGTGQVKLLGGTLTFTSPQAYSGATTISAGTLAIAPGASLSSSQTVADNGVLDISATSGTSIQSLSGNGAVQLGAQTLTLTNAQDSFSGSILGTGGVTLTGGTQTFAGVNSFTGTTLISSGTLILTNISALTSSPLVDNGVLDISTAFNALSSLVVVTTPSLSGSGQVLLGNSTLNLTNAADTFSGTIAGAGGLTISAGTETLTNANSYTGTTAISGTLLLTGSGTLSSSTLVADSGVFDISGVSGSATAGSLSGSGGVALGANTLVLGNGKGDFSGIVAGTGGLTLEGGTQILSGANTYSGGTTIDAGTLQLGDGKTGAAILGNVSDAGTLAFDYAATTTTVFSGVISGAGGVSQIGAGTTVLTGQNTYTGATLISMGTLQLGNGGTSGGITGNVLVNGTLAFDRSNAVTFGGVISGSGGVNQLGSGTLLLNASNSYTGATAIAAGSTLVIGQPDSIATSSHVTDNGTLDVSGVSGPQLSSLGGSGTVLLGPQSLSITKASDTFSGAISGTGGLVVAGGMQTLAGASSYSGATEVKGGTLAVSGSIASSSGVTVDAGGTLAGSGTVPQLSVNGGSVAPGLNGAGTLTVAGPVTFASGSNFLVNGSSTSAPVLAASGSASLNGTISFASTDGTYPVGQKLTVLTAAGGVSGSFAAGTLTAANGAQFSQSVSTDANDVFLTVNLAKLSPALSSGASLNQASAIAGIDKAIADGSALPSAFGSLANLSSAALTAGAQQLAGELGADLAQADNAMIAPYENAVFNRLDGMVGSRHVRRALLQTGPHIWGAIVGGTDVTASTAADGSGKFSTSAAALVAGVDWPVSPNLTLGGAVSFGSDHFHVEDGLGRGKSTAFQFGVYGAVQFTPRIYGAFLGSFGQDAVTTDRQLTVSGTDDLTASLTSQDFVARYETGIDLHWITPYAALGERLSLMPAYSETAASGSSNFALSYAANTRNRLDTELGFRNQADLPMNRNWTLHLSDKLAWQHAVFSSYEAPASYSALAGSQFTTYGAQPGKDLAVWSLGAGIKNRYGLDIGLQVDSSLSKHSQSYDGVGHIALNW